MEKYIPELDDNFLLQQEKEELIQAVLDADNGDIPEDRMEAFIFGMGVAFGMVNEMHSGKGIADWKDEEVRSFAMYVLQKTGGHRCTGYAEGVFDAVKMMIIREKCFGSVRIQRLVDAMRN